MSARPETVPAVVVSVEDRLGVEPSPARLAGLTTVARLAWRLTGLARRPLAVPLAIAAVPLTRIGAERDTLVALRSGGRDVEAAEVAATATGDRVVVLVPPPGRDERVWDSGRDHTGATYADRLGALLGWDAVHLRIAGDPVEAVGPAAAVALSALLQRLVDAWPVPPARICLLGYGAGGLLARNALGLVASEPGPWQSQVTDLVALGTPPYGVTSAPVSGGLGRRIDEQLAGIAVLDEAVVATPPRAGVDYIVVSDAATTRPNRIGRVLGDLLWWRHKGVGRARRVRDLFPGAERLVVATGATPLSNHPEVHDFLVRRLA